MATRQMSPAKSQTGSRSLTRALALAFNEWLLMLMLFANSIFSYVIAKFADYSELQSPCLMCSRLDHILGRTKHLKKSHWDMVCSKHKSEISSLVYCHAHGKLVDVRGIDVRTGKLSTPKKSVRFNQLPHVGYTELKIHSDTESEAVFSEDEGVVVKEEDHMFQNVDLETPPVITLPYDLATDKLLNLDFPLQPLVARNDREEVHLQEIDLRTNSFFPDLIPVDGMPEISENVLKEEEIISLDNLFLTSRAMEHPAAISREKEELIPLQDVSLTPEFKEVLKEEEVVSLDNLFLTSRAMEHSEVVSKVKEDLIHLQDISVTPDFKEKSENALMEETELICLNDVTSTSDAAESAEDHVLMKETVLNEKEDLIHLQDTSLTPNIKGNPAYALMEDTELICLNDVTSTSDAAETTEDVLMEETVLEEKEDLIHLQDTSLLPDFKDNPPYALMETELIPLNDVTSTSSDPAETPEDVLKGIELMSPHDIFRDKTPESFTTNETLVETSTERGTNQADINSLESEYVVVSPSTSTKSMPENSTEKCESENKGMKETSPTVSSVSEMASHTEAALESESASFNSMSVAAETNLGSGESWMQGGELLNLADAYNIIVHNEGSKDSNGVAQIEQWMKKDTSRVSEDLKALLTQISASRGIEFLSPRDISPKISSDQETKNLDHDMQLLIQRRMLERNESNLSLEGVSVSEIEGESESDRLKRQVDHDRKLLTGLYKELEEERSASAVATNQAMAMITRLQEEKALFQMEALQNLRMMEEQAEYDMEAIQKLNDLLVEREKLIQDLEAEIDYFRDQTPQKKKLDNVTGIDSPSEGMSNKIQNCLSGFNEERLYIASCLEKIENRVQTDVNGEAHVDNLPTQESVSELHERVERLKGDMYFLEHVVNSLGHGNEGVQFVKEIASHLQTLRSLSMKRKDHTEC
ncbi:hypothetical protein EUTSA_v10006726mg [Eutrema salsugineum]|uniref:GTD-binding domain-containing protein n=1 Tax=Eutrema salsugineum TaxID=72664 RepID=V4KXG6_EUTSA|nr:hypothetical protein EUTSA_v10006726mg [Eutrema salsugineum]